ncbi:MAG TPA: porin family protein [Caulobacteraceae bacterium]|jgi:hypothetical protein
MIKSLVAAGALGAALISAPAVAQPLAMPTDTSVYGTLGYSHGSYEDVDLGGITGRLGVRFGRFFGVEGEATVGVTSDEVNIAGTDVDVDLNHDLGVYAVGFAPVNPNFDILGRVGYASTDLEASAGGFSASGSNESWNFGVGAQYYFDGANGVRGEYTRKEFDDNGAGGDASADVWSLAYTRRF